MYSMRNGTEVKNQAFCNQWGTDDYPGLFYCFLRGGLSAAVCPGAKKHGNIYYTSHPSVCIDAGNKGTKEGGKHRNQHLVYMLFF